MIDISNIAPYKDEDVPHIINRLVNDDSFIEAIGRLKFKGWYSLLSLILKPKIRSFVKSRAKNIHSVHDFQMEIEPILAKVLSNTTEAFTVSGLDNLDPNQSYVFLSNHRDIAMDPTFVNWALHTGGFQTVRIAIGDNLVKRPFVGDLMRLNKSFIVKRNISGPREMLQTYSTLSHYIRNSIEEKHSIWIAHREGRAKNGIDRTDPAILKMLAMGGKSRNESFRQSVEALRIVPVSISYEFDPCAPMKARELAITERDGEYIKQPNEDVASIARGIMGWKGRVHLHFAPPLTEVPEKPQELASLIDHQIIIAQQVFDTGRFAEAILRQHDLPEDLLPDVKKRFQSLVSGTPEKYRDKLLEIYANPLRQLALHQQSDPLRL